MDPDALPMTVWLFVRGNLSVRIEAQRAEDTFRLEIRGPGDQRRTMHAPDLTVLVEAQAEVEAALIALGFSLDQFTSERRRSPR